MFASKLPWLYVLQVILVATCVITALCVTGNALALFGILLMWGSPPITLEPRREGGETDARGHQIGFVHDEEDGE
jgi:hypothetical protein